MSSQWTGTYNLHDLVSVRLTARPCGRWRSRLLDAKLSALAGEVAAPADIEMHIGPFRPDIPPEAVVIDKDFHVAADYVYYRGLRSGGATEIRGLSEPHTVIRHEPYAEGLLRRPAMGLRGINMYLEPALAWRLGRRGGQLLHAAAVAREGKALVLCGTNGSFKTRIALELCLRRGWSLLGDDMVILRDRKVLSFLEHPAVLHARAEAVLAGGAPRAGGLSLALGLMRGRHRRCEALAVADSAELGGLVLLERISGSSQTAVAPAESKDVWAHAAALELLEWNKHQRRHRQVTNFGRFITAYEYTYPQSEIFRHMQLDGPPMPGWLDVPALCCRLGESWDGGIPDRLLDAWESLGRSA